MRKFTLLIASLFITMGAMAQTVVTAINTEKYYTLKCKATDHSQYIGVTGAGEINGRSTTAVRIKFEAAEGGYYIKAGDKYLNNSANGSALVTEETGKTVWALNAPSHTSGVVTFGCGDDFYLNNNYTGGTPYLKSNKHSGGPGSGNACSLWEMREYEPTPVFNTSDFVNGKMYTFVTERGWMGASASSSNAISTAKTAGDTNSDYFKWAVYKSVNNNYYVYNIGKGQFLGAMSATANASVPMSEKAVKVTFKQTGTHYPIMFTTLNDGNCVANHSSAHGEGFITWNGGWSSLTDTGNGHLITEAGDVETATLEAIIAAVEAAEVDNTVAVAALDAAIAKAQALFGQITVGDGLGEYTSTDPDYMTKYEAIIAFRNAIEAVTTPTPAEVEAKTAELEAVIASFQLNLPVAGKYYRILAVEGWNDDARYLGAQNSTAKGGRAEFVATADANSIFYFDGSNLVSYVSGYYLVSNSNFAGYNGVQTSGTKFAFHAASNNLVGAYNISFNDGNRWLYCHQSNYTDAGGRGTQNGYCFNIEEVETLPVTVSAAGYATFYAPVAVTVPAGVTAHTVTINGEWATLSEALTVIPAETGVVLAGEGSHDLAITTTDATVESDLEGTVAATYIAKDAYVLSTGENGVGFYGAILNQQSNTAFLNNSHKAYLYVASEGAEAASYSFRFGEGTTGISEVKGESGNAKAIYDLTGRRVENITAPGIYIINGVKVLVK